MNWSRFRCLSVAPFGLGVALLWVSERWGLRLREDRRRRGRASPGAGPVDSAGRGVAPGRQARRGCGRRRARPGAGAPGRGGEPRPDGRGAVPAGRAARTAGRLGKAVGRRKEALAIRERVDGKEHWRTADARLALAFAEKVAGLGAGGAGQGGKPPCGRNRRRPDWRSRASSPRRSAWRWKRWRPTGHWSVRSRRRWRGPGIESAGAGGHGTTQAEPRRPTSGR